MRKYQLTIEAARINKIEWGVSEHLPTLWLDSNVMEATTISVEWMKAKCPQAGDFLVFYNRGTENAYHTCLPAQMMSSSCVERVK